MNYRGGSDHKRKKVEVDKVIEREGKEFLSSPGRSNINAHLVALFGSRDFGII